MEVERAPATSLVAGDLVSVTARRGWWTVTEVSAGPGGVVDVRLASVFDAESSVLRCAPDDVVRRADPTSVHHRDEFLGLNVAEARAWAGALGWAFRDRTGGDFVTGDISSHRVNVWADEAGIVVRAELY